MSHGYDRSAVTALERKGQRLVFAVAAWAALPLGLNLVSLVLGQNSKPSDWFWDGAIALAGWLLIRGNKWARYGAVVAFGLFSGTLLLFWLVQGGPWQAQALIVAYALGYMIAATVLWSSSAVEAFFLSRRASPTTLQS